MPKITPVKPRIFIKFLKHIGCVEAHKKGGHVSFKRDDLLRCVVVPIHNEVSAAVIRNNLKTLGMTTEQYLEIMKDL